MDNSADERGGGMYNSDASPVLSSCSFTGNSAGSGWGGGGMYNNSSSPTLSNCTFASNIAGVGGAVFNESSSPSLTGCEFTNNSTESGGGAMLNYESGPVLVDCVFSGNSTNGIGGGIKNEVSSSPAFENCTFTGNSAESGGAMFSESDGSLPTFVTCVICWNTPDQILGDYTDLGGNCISEVCDTDGDGALDCDDNCPDDPNKTEPGDCGCGVAETDTDGDGTQDCLDNCPDDPNKTEPGACGCGTPESGDSDGDGIADCNDPCPNWPYDCSEDGQTITVAVGQSIQQAIDAVPDGGTVAIAAGTFPLTGPLDPGGRAMTIRGPTDADGNPTAILDGQGSTRVLICQNGETSATVFENLVIQNGSASGSGSAGYGGGMYNPNGSPVVISCVFRGNDANEGGGMFNGGWGTGGGTVQPLRIVNSIRTPQLKAVVAWQMSEAVRAFLIVAL